VNQKSELVSAAVKVRGAQLFPTKDLFSNIELYEIYHYKFSANIALFQFCENRSQNVTCNIIANSSVNPNGDKYFPIYMHRYRKKDQNLYGLFHLNGKKILKSV